MELIDTNCRLTFARMKKLRGALLPTMLGALLALPSEKSWGYPAWTNGWHLNSPLQAGSNADLVCKIQVLSTRQAEIIKRYLPGGQADPSRMLAKSRVLSVIKGECKPAIDIEFHDRNLGTSAFGPSPGRGTELTKGDVCVVFLKRQEGRYTLNRIRSKLRVQPKVVDHSLGETPGLRACVKSGYNAVFGRYKRYGTDTISKRSDG